MKSQLSVSVGLPAYNEEGNIRNILQAYVDQKSNIISISEIIIISSGSTDNTNKIAQEFVKRYSRFKLIVEPDRRGKASAINVFLKHAKENILVIQSTDTIPAEDTIEELCAPFISDPDLGMTGGAPIPINDKKRFIGYIVHVWWWFHRNIPRFGEIIAFRKIISEIPITTAVDEAYIQALMLKKGYKLQHVDAAVVYNKGPETLEDLIKQRRRILNGHIRLYEEQNVRIHNMTKRGLKLLLFDHKMRNLKELVWTIVGLMIEVYVNLLGRYDKSIGKINPYIWRVAVSTKNIDARVIETK